jgi:hypothetical protein
VTTNNQRRKLTLQWAEMAVQAELVELAVKVAKVEPTQSTTWRRAGIKILLMSAAATAVATAVAVAIKKLMVEMLTAVTAETPMAATPILAALLPRYPHIQKNPLFFTYIAGITIKT